MGNEIVIKDLLRHELLRTLVSQSKRVCFICSHLK